MDFADIPETIKEKIVALDLDGTLIAYQKALDHGITPKDMIENVITSAVADIGDLFEKGEFFLPELIFPGEILTRVAKLIESSFPEASSKQNGGKILIGTGKELWIGTP